MRDQALQQTNVFDTVRHLLSADENLAPFFDSLLDPVRPKHAPIFQRHAFRFTYSSVDIQPAGVVLHGTLSVTDFAAAHVEYETIPTTDGLGQPGGSTGGVFSGGPDYSALKSWIPGGTIQRYEWLLEGQSQPSVDEHRFVLLQPGPVIGDANRSSSPLTGYSSVCLTVRGSRLSSSGPIVAQPVSATFCAYTEVAVVNGVELQGVPLPMVTLTRPGPRGSLEVVGHAEAQIDRAGRGTPNRLVHFADGASAGQLEVLTQAVQDSQQDGVTTVVLAVLTPEALTRAGYATGIVYTEDQGGVWARAFGVKSARRPLTLIVDPKGTVVWRREGPLDRATLAAALRRYLVAGVVSPGLLRVPLRIGQPPPDFLFEAAPGRRLTVRKLEGRAVVLVFWKSTSPASLAAVRDACATGAAGDLVVLAINDGETAEVATRAAAANDLTATLVLDRQRRIGLAYGVKVWPTTVSIDTDGLVRSTQHGRQTRHARYA